MVDTSPHNHGRDEIGRKGSAGMTGSTMQRESPGQKVKQGWNEFKAKVKGKWNTLNDKDIDQYQGRRRDDFVNFVGDRVGGDRTAIGRDIDTYAKDTNYRWNE